MKKQCYNNSWFIYLLCFCSMKWNTLTRSAHHHTSTINGASTQQHCFDKGHRRRRILHDKIKNRKTKKKQNPCPPAGSLSLYIYVDCCNWEEDLLVYTMYTYGRALTVYGKCACAVHSKYVIRWGCS